MTQAERIANAEERKAEALERMNMLQGLGYWDEAADLYRDHGIPCISLRSPMEINGQRMLIGTVYRLDEMPTADERGEDVLKAIADFEQEWDGTIYAGSRETTAFGELLTLFYVSQYVEEWEADREDLEGKCPVCYVANLDDSMSSEFGHIGYELSGGGIVRTA